MKPTDVNMVTNVTLPMKISPKGVRGRSFVGKGFYVINMNMFVYTLY